MIIDLSGAEHFCTEARIRDVVVSIHILDTLVIKSSHLIQISHTNRYTSFQGIRTGPTATPTSASVGNIPKE